MTAAAMHSWTVSASPKNSTARMPRKKGARAKYALVLAAPRCLSARTNKTRLNPYPTKPTAVAPAIAPRRGIAYPKPNARERLTTPATTPFSPATSIGSLADTFRVRLLSIAQQRHAAPTSSAPRDILLHPSGPMESTTLPATIAAIPHAIRQSKFSRKTNHASPAVNADSRFRSKDAVDAAVVVKPDIKRMGPKIPPKRIAALSHAHSPRDGHTTGAAFRMTKTRSSCTMARPAPDPAYNRPARAIGCISPSSSFARGVLAPNNAAASSAYVTP